MEMKNETLVAKQADGYKAEISDTGIVTFYKGAKKGKSLHVTHLKPFDALEKHTQEFIKSKLNDTTGLWYSGNGICRLRDVDGACQKVLAEIEKYNVENEAEKHTQKIEADARFEAAKKQAEKQVGCAVKLVSVRYFDGYPSTLKVDGVEVNLSENYKHVVTVENMNWMPVDVAEKAKTEAEEKDAAQKQKKQAAVDAETVRRNELIDAAKTTGKKQVLRHYTSSECLDNLPDCSFDNVTIWIDAQGRESQTHTHCF